MPQAIERKSYPITELKADDETGIIEAIVSVFNNVDSGKEIVRQGFFNKSIARKLPKGVWAHDWKQPIAKTLEAKEIPPGDPSLPAALMELGGTYIKGQFNLDTQRGKEAYSDIKFGIVDEFSIGYKVTKESKDSETGARELIEGDWKEWSPVLVGMNDQTRLLSIKSENQESKGLLEDCIEECEESLYFLSDKYQMACWRAQMLADADSSFDLVGAIGTICDELRARTIAALTKPDAMGDMGSMADTRPMSFKGDPRDGLSFAKHTEAVLATVEVFANKASVAAELAEEFRARGQSIMELRFKEGRTYSSGNLAHMQRVHDAIGKVKKGVMAVHSDMAALIAKAKKPEKSDGDLDVAALRTQSLRVQSRAITN